MAGRRCSITLYPPYLECLDRLLDAGFYKDQQEVFRAALRVLFKDHGLEDFCFHMEEENGPPNYLHGKKGRNHTNYRSRRAHAHFSF